MDNYKVVRYKKKKYAVICVKYKPRDQTTEHLPGLIDYQDLDILVRIKKKWRCNKNKFISCSHTHNNVTKDVYLHEIIMALKQRDLGKEELEMSIVHINNIGLDNRRENLIYDTSKKNIKKNNKKKKRTITLPKDSGIEPDEIPTYVWFMNPDKTHGPRFMVSIGNVKWKTTSSRKYSLRYKLEEAKMYLRQLKEDRPELFDDYSMNGDYTKLGRKLMRSYYDIVHLANYEHIRRYTPQDKTSQYIKAGKIDKKERLLLKLQGNLVKKTNKNRRIKNNLPGECGIRSSDLPKYCYYKPEYKGRGGYFVVEGHPNQNKIWQTSSSKKVSVDTKYQQLLDYLKTIQ